jgi:hypothetical protein
VLIQALCHEDIWGSGCIAQPFFTSALDTAICEDNKSAHRITGFFLVFPLSGVLWSRNTMFRKLDLFLYSGEEGRRHQLSWAPLKVALSKGSNRGGVFSPLHLTTETDSVSETSCFYPMNTGRWKKSKNPVILCAICHRQNPLKCLVIEITLSKGPN